MMPAPQLKERKIVKIDPPKVGFYRLHFDDGDAKLVPRLTTKLGILDKPALKHWSANIEREYVIEKAKELFQNIVSFKDQTDVGFETALRSKLGEKRAHQMRLKTAGAIGTSLHKAIQHHLKCMMSPLKIGIDAEGPALFAYMAWEDWAESVNLEPTHVETMLGSERLDVAGTMDCAGNVSLPNDGINRTHCIFDWKSSARSKTAPNGIYPEAEIQVSGYRTLAIEMGLADDDSWAAVVRLPKNEDDPVLKEKEPFDVKWIDPERADYLARGFEAIGSAYTFMEAAFPK